MFNVEQMTCLRHLDIWHVGMCRCVALIIPRSLIGPLTTLVRYQRLGEGGGCTGPLAVVGMTPICWAVHRGLGRLLPYWHAMRHAMPLKAINGSSATSLLLGDEGDDARIQEATFMAHAEAPVTLSHRTISTYLSRSPFPPKSIAFVPLSLFPDAARPEIKAGRV